MARKMVVIIDNSNQYICSKMYIKEVEVEEREPLHSKLHTSYIFLITDFVQARRDYLSHHEKDMLLHPL